MDTRAVLQRILLVAASAVVAGALFVLAGKLWNRAFQSESGDSSSQADGFAADVELDPARQKQIWDAEHATFLIETYVGKPFVAALRENDAERLGAFFLPAATCRLLDEKPDVERSQAGIREIVWGRAADSGNATAVAPDSKADAQALVGRLLKIRQDWASVSSARLRVLKIESVAAGEAASGSSNHWRARLLLTARGSGEDGTLREHLSEHDVQIRFDDEDALKQGKPVVSDWRMLWSRSRRAAQPLMQEVTAEVGLDRLPLADNWKLPPPRNAKQYRYQIAVEDFDRDGWLDVAVCSFEGSPFYLLRSMQGSRFRDVTQSVGLPVAPDPYRTKIHLCTWIDFDNDGYPDLLLDDRLYRNVAGRRFVDVTPESGLTFHDGEMGATVVDYDCDGRLDLYVLYQESADGRPPERVPWVGDDHSGGENRLWRNEGNGRFRDVTDEANAGGGRRHSFAAAWLFFDDDHYPDVYIANDFGENVLLRNRGDGTFEDISHQSGASDYATSMGVVAGHLTNAEVPELYVANMYSKMGRRIIAHVSEEDYPPGLFAQIQGSCAGNRLYRMDPERGRYQEIGEQAGVTQVGWAYAPAILDLDGDGWQDLYATTGFLSFDRHKPDG